MTKLRPVFILVLWFAAAGFAYLIQRDLASPAVRFTLEDSLGRILGSAKEAVGDTLFLKADEYYHGGVTVDAHAHEEDLGAPHDEERERIERASRADRPTDWIDRINRRVQAHEHRHLVGGERKEILPFFALSTALDPYNVQAVLAASYWLDGQFDKTDEAIGVLLKGAGDNPDAWEIDKELARLYWLRKKDAASCERFSLSAIRKSGRETVESYVRVDLYYYLAEALLAQGKRAEAISAYRRALGFYDPGHPAALKEKIERRIAELAGP